MATAILMVLLLLYEVTGTSWTVDTKDAVTVHMHQTTSLPFSINSTDDLSNFTLTPISDANIATVNVEVVKHIDNVWYGDLNISGVFLGSTKVSLHLNSSQIAGDDKEIMTVTVIREERTIDTVFTASVAILVSILYINFGCAMDWSVCRSTLRKPIGPAIGFFCQFLFMPLLSYGIGYLLFPDRPELQIGMFFTGISPSGGASNIWTVLLDGNLNLSVTMTTLCTVAAFGMMPFWIFTLGRHIFARGQIVVPYSRIAVFAIGLVIPLAIGFLIQRKLPRLSRILVRIMKPFSIVLIVFIIVFAILTNLYLFKLFSLQIIIAGMGLPWIGFIFGLLMGIIFKQPYHDIKAISIETGIQNTGVAIFLLRFTLPAPAADLTTVVPVSSAIMTPLPLIVLYLGKLIYNCRNKTSLNIDPSTEKLQTDVSTITRPYEN